MCVPRTPKVGQLLFTRLKSPSLVVIDPACDGQVPADFMSTSNRVPSTIAESFTSLGSVVSVKDAASRVISVMGLPLL